MRIVTIEIRNLRNVKFLRLDNLPQLVVLAGQNGTGKSTILEAIKIWKERVTGPYGNQSNHASISEMIRVEEDDAEIPLPWRSDQPNFAP